MHPPSEKRQVELHYVWQMIGPFRRRAALVLLLVIADTALASLGVGMVLPVFQTLLDPEHKNTLLTTVLPFLSDLEPMSRLLLLAGITVLVFAAKAGVSLVSATTSNDFLQRLRLHWIGLIGEHYLYGPLRRLNSRKQGELLNDWFNETLASTRFYQSYIVYFSSGLLVLTLIVLGLMIKWQAMLAMLLFGAIVVALARGYLFGSSSRLSRVKVGLAQEITTCMVENISHAREVKLMRAEGRRLEQLAQLCRQLRTTLTRGALFADIPRVAGELLAVTAMMAFVVVGIVVLKTPPSEMLPMLMFFFVTFYRLISAGSAAMTARVRALNELHSLHLVSSLVSSVQGRENLGEGTALRSIDTDIRLCGIGFAYDPSRQVLADVNAVFPKGRTTYLVGPSGAGKSTLLDILMRLESPTEGHVEVNGRPAFEYRLADWRGLFGYVSQDATLFNGDIRMNMRLTRPDATDRDIEEACRLAGAHDFIAALPHGYDTIVGDRGYSLSGGQRKRVAIARALVGQPAVLILDEATTSFEHSLEQDLRKALHLAMPGLTVIAVTHRLQTVSDTDWVVAMEDGRVSACGQWGEVQTHAERFVAERVEGFA